MSKLADGEAERDARAAHADEMIGPVMFLVSDAAKNITGVLLPVDGGRTA